MAAPVFDAASNASGSGAGPFTFSHTTSGSDRVMWIGISYYHPSVTISAVTYNAVAATLVPLASADNGDYHARLYYLIAPATGSNTVSVSVSGSVYSLGVGVTTVTGANQTTPYGTAVTATGNDSTPTVNVLAASDELAIDTLCIIHSGTLSVGSSQTSRWNAITSNGFIKYAGSTEAGAGTTTMSWSNTTAQTWALVAVAIKPVAAGGGSTVPVFVHHLRQQGIA